MIHLNIGAIIDDKGSKAEILSRTGQIIAALSNLNAIWHDTLLHLKAKVQSMQSLVNSIFLYACETWTLSKDLQKRIRPLEMRCFRILLNINYKNIVTNVEFIGRVSYRTS